MEAEVAGPGVQHHRHAELGTETRGIPCEREERLGGCGEEQVEDRLAVSHRHRAKLGREGEDDVEVAYREQTLQALVDPSGLREGLALRAVTVAARVVGRLVVATRGAHVEVPAEDGSSASLDGPQGRVLLRAQHTVTSQRSTVSADDVGELEPAARQREWARRRILHRGQPGSVVVPSVSSGLTIDCTRAVLT